MVSTVHQTRNQERNSPFHRAGSLPACSLASVLHRLECPIHSPFYRKLSSAPDTFLLPSRTSDLHWTFLSCLSTGAISILPLCPGSVLLPQSRDPRQAPKCYAQCPNPRAGREKASKTMQLARKGKLITDSSQGSCHNQHSGAGSESPEPKLLHKFIG